MVSGTLRSPFDLASLTPEAKNLGGDNGFMLGGGQAASYGTNLDGVSANTTRALSKSWVATNSPSVEAITEFTVDTNGFKAEFGHAGGGVMNFVSKSGTNAFHGSAYEFLRNNALDANNFFNNRAGIAIPVYKQHDFGASIGGPVWIPKIYKGKNKTFFFFSYEAFRNRAGATGFSQTIPTPEMYTGDFSNWVDRNNKQIPIFDPTSQVKNAGRKLHPHAVRGQQDSDQHVRLRVGEGVGCVHRQRGAETEYRRRTWNRRLRPEQLLRVERINVTPNTKISVKGDHIFNEKHRISGYYGYNREKVEPGSGGPPTLPGFYSTYNDTRQASDVFRFSWDWTLSPTKLNHFFAGGNNWRQNHDPPQATVVSGIDWKSKVCLGNVPDCSQNLLNLSFSGDGLSNWGGPANNGSENTIYSYNDDFTMVKGTHTFKAGGALQVSHYNGFGRQCISGCATFSYINTGVPGGNNPQLGGSSFASLLLGYANGGSIDTIRFIGQQWSAFSGYIQDDWHVSRKLNLNLGLRWETQMPPTGLEDRWSDFSPTTPNPRAGGIPGALIYAGTGTGRQGTPDAGRQLVQRLWPAPWVCLSVG